MLKHGVVSQTLYAFHRVYWVPQPEGPDAPPTVFSEARAMAHTAHLATTIGDRQVGLPSPDIPEKLCPW